MQFTLYHEWELVAKNWGTTLLLHRSFNSFSCIFCPSRFLQKRLLRRSWLESGHGWLAPRVAIGCHRFLVQPARFQRGRSSAFSPGLFDNYCLRDFNKLDRSALPLWKYFQFKAEFDPNRFHGVPALLCLYAQKWMKCDNKVKPVQMGSNLIGSPMMDCKSDKVVINKKTILAWKTNSCPTLAAFRPNL